MFEETIDQAEDNDFEEICSDEVDRVVEVLDGLIENIQSENVKHFLEEASSSIYYLVYEDDGNDATAEAEDGDEMEQAA
ncbi:MAG: hypothetical protein GY758_11450 [Fuerstiella sp.]|jgi:hypothetical protein|nr:hypothetical protein [Fuerstiella sp.]MCP4510008.1 hypothetical protein [Fuerstiella sp.]MDG2130522.1 hypothetical protein [Fuerstiella sp.]